MPRASPSLTLTARDLELLAFIADHRAVPLEHLAARFFAADPITRKKNRDPMHACLRRIKTLAKARCLWLQTEHDGVRRRRVARPGPSANDALGSCADRRRIAPSKRAHHLRTLDIIAKAEAAAARQCGRIVRTRLEGDLRREQQAGRFARAGDRFDMLPDAVCTFERTVGERLQRLEVAIEYVTRKYSSADILKKHEAFSAYDRVLWYADRPATAARVKRLTGAPCGWLS